MLLSTMLNMVFLSVLLPFHALTLVLRLLPQRPLCSLVFLIALLWQSTSLSQTTGVTNSVA